MGDQASDARDQPRPRKTAGLLVTEVLLYCTNDINHEVKVHSEEAER